MKILLVKTYFIERRKKDRNRQRQKSSARTIFWAEAGRPDGPARCRPGRMSTLKISVLEISAIMCVRIFRFIEKSKRQSNGIVKTKSQSLNFFPTLFLEKSQSHNFDLTWLCDFRTICELFYPTDHLVNRYIHS